MISEEAGSLRSVMRTRSPRPVMQAGSLRSVRGIIPYNAYSSRKIHFKIQFFGDL
jgi:hypothetical protein